jgi:hypothetical protein
MSETIIEVPNYPFVRTEYHGCDAEGPYTDEVWRPGCNQETDEDGTDFTADDTGTMLLTVVSAHKPGRFPERTFFTRRWRDPDGREFGSYKLRMTTTQAFKQLCKGYRHSFFNCKTQTEINQ